VYNYTISKSSEKIPAFRNLIGKLHKYHNKEYECIYSYFENVLSSFYCKKSHYKRIIRFSINLALNLKRRKRLFDYYANIENSQVKSNYIQIPLKSNYYSDKQYLEENNIWNISVSKYKLSYHMVLVSIKLLQKLNIVSIDKGYRKYNLLEVIDGIPKYEIEESVMTKLYIKDELEWNIEKYLNKENQLNFLKAVEIHTILNMSLKQKNDIKHKILSKDYVVMTEKSYDQNDTSIHYRRAPLKHRIFMHKLNIKIQKMGFSPCMYQYRIFGYNTYENGRFYDPITFIKKAVREKLLKYFNYKEIDFEASAINIFHLYDSGKRYKGDPYIAVMLNTNEAKKHLGNVDIVNWRKIFKNIINISLATSYHKGKAAIINLLIENNLYRLDETPMLQDGTLKFSWYSIFTSIKETFPSLYEKNLIFNNQSSSMMNIESHCALLMKKEMLKQNIYPITIHDAFIVPESKYDYFNTYKDNALHVSISRYFKNQRKKIVSSLISKKLNSILKIKLSITQPIFYYLKSLHSNTSFNNSTHFNSNIIIYKSIEYWIMVLRRILLGKKINWEKLKIELDIPDEKLELSIP
jgi:hypothetical protein